MDAATTLRILALRLESVGEAVSHSALRREVARLCDEDRRGLVMNGPLPSSPDIAFFLNWSERVASVDFDQTLAAVQEADSADVREGLAELIDGIMRCSPTSLDDLTWAILNLVDEQTAARAANLLHAIMPMKMETSRRW